jgi:sialic acid synthase
MKRKLRIKDVEISDDSNVFVIAEIGHNHQGSIETCERLFTEASSAGATAVKLQKRDNKSLFTKEFYDSAYEGPTSFGKTYGEHREFLEFDFKAYKHLKKYAENLGLIFFATAFDQKSLEFLVELKTPAIKLASGDIKSLPFIRKVANTGLPVIMSTGGATMHDIELAISHVDPEQCALLQCTAAYPAEAELMDLRVIQTFREAFPSTVIGLSSHDKGILFPVIAATLGARVIEKHFTLDRTMKGTDHAFSLEPQGMRKMVRDLGLGISSLGSSAKRVHDQESRGVRKMAKMMVWASSLAEGHVITEHDIEFKSPMDGLSPQHFQEVLGKKLNRQVQEDDPVVLSDLV